MPRSGRLYESVGMGKRAIIPESLDVNGIIKVNKTKDKFIQEYFEDQPLTTGPGGVAVSTTISQTNVCSMGDINFELHNDTAQVGVVGPIKTTSGGVSISNGTGTPSGLEYGFGTGLVNNKANFIVGKSPAFYVKLKANTDNITALISYIVGFRTIEAYQADYTAYTDFAGLRLNSGNILAIDKTSSVDTTLDWANDETHTFEIYVDELGVVTYKVDGITPTTTNPYVFAADTIVIPFIKYLRVASGVDLYLLYFECGYQS